MKTLTMAALALLLVMNFGRASAEDVGSETGLSGSFSQSMAAANKTSAQLAHSRALQTLLGKIDKLRDEISMASVEEAAAAPGRRADYELVGSRCAKPDPADPSKCYETAADFAPAMTYSAEKLRKYHEQAAGSLGKSASAFESILDLIREASKDGVYSDEERKALGGLAGRLGQDYSLLRSISSATVKSHEAYVTGLQGNDGNASAEYGKVSDALRKATKMYLKVYGDRAQEALELVLKLNGRYDDWNGRCARFEPGYYSDEPRCVLVVISGNDTPRDAGAALSKALNEKMENSVLLFRSTPENEKAIGKLADDAAKVARGVEPTGRVVWIKNQDLLPKDLIHAYFGDDHKVAIASLSWGKDDRRQVVERFPPNLDGIEIWRAFNDVLEDGLLRDPAISEFDRKGILESIKKNGKLSDWPQKPIRTQ